MQICAMAETGFYGLYQLQYMVYNKQETHAHFIRNKSFLYSKY